MFLNTIRLLCLICLHSFLFADVIDLKDGTRIEGRILSENEDSLEIEIGQNETGTIRRVLIIHSSEVSSWVADGEGRVLKQKNEDVDRLDGKKYIEKLIKDASEEIDQGNFEAGVNQFENAADLAVVDLDKKELSQKVESLSMRELALRLQLSAMEGAMDALVFRTDGLQEALEDKQKALEKDISEYRRDKRNQEREIEEESAQLGSRFMKSDLQIRESRLLKRKAELDKEATSVESRLKQTEVEKMKIETKIKLAEHQLERTEDDLKAAERSLRRR